jgi:hypothetical protein
MNRLKPCSELAIPDSRWNGRPIAAIYEIASSIRLHPGVPEPVHTHFAAAQNLLAYSWFHYPFNVTAQFMAYVSVEAALKLRYAEQAKSSFRALVKRAIREGTVTDTGFTHVRQRIEQTETEEATDRRWLARESMQVKPYVDVLTETMPGLRNSFAHGEYMLHNHGAFHVRICAEFINQLFTEPQ